MKQFFEKCLSRFGKTNTRNLIEKHFSCKKNPKDLVLDNTFTKLDFASNEFMLQHKTSEEVAYAILDSQMIYGEDSDCAHFEYIQANINFPYQSGAIIYFKWVGEQESVSLKHERKPNKLFHVSVWDYSIVEDSGQGYWESRLYPGTHSGLEAIGFSIDSNNHSFFQLERPINIKVVSQY